MKGDQNRRTPPWLFGALQKELGVKFKLDVAASNENALCKKFFTEKDNALVQKWTGPAFVNPPFKHMGAFISKARDEAYERDIVICVIGPTGCSQSWFHNVAKVGRVLVPNRRIVFYDSATGEPTGGADRDTMIYTFGPGRWRRCASGFDMETFDVAGKVITSRNA